MKKEIIVWILMSVLTLSSIIFGAVNYYNVNKMVKIIGKSFRISKEELFNADDLKRWSEYQGNLSLYDAKKKCEALGKGWRLPKRAEWQINFEANKKVLLDEWTKGLNYYYHWTSEEYSEFISYLFSVDDGNVTSYYNDTVRPIRCIR